MKNPNRLDEAPEKLLSVFSETKIILWVCVAVVLHIVVLAATSLTYVRDRWIDPEGAAARKTARDAASSASASLPSAGDAQSVQPPTSNTAAAGDQSIPEEVKNTPVVKRITEAAATNEIPPQPTDIGISIDDTNPR